MMINSFQGSMLNFHEKNIKMTLIFPAKIHKLLILNKKRFELEIYASLNQRRTDCAAPFEHECRLTPRSSMISVAHVILSIFTIQVKFLLKVLNSVWKVMCWTNKLGLVLATPPRVLYSALLDPLGKDFRLLDHLVVFTTKYPTYFLI